MEFWAGSVRVKMHFWFFLVVGVFGYLDPTDSVGLVLMAILIHEMGHVVAMWCCGVHVAAVELGPFGARIATDRARVRSYINELFIYLAGPLFGLLAGAISLVLGQAEAQRFALINVGLSLFNLLPIETLDGGCLLYTALSGFWGPVKASRWLKVTSYLIIIPLYLAAFTLLLAGGQNISLLITCTYLALTALLR